LNSANASARSVDVRGDDAPGVRREHQRLDAVARADVERALDSPAHRQRRQHDRRPVHRRHVVGRCAAVRPIGRDHEPVVRDEPYGGRDRPAPLLDETERVQVAQRVAEGALAVRDVDSQAEHEETEQVRERALVAVEPADVDREVAAREQHLARVQPALDAVAVEARLAQKRPHRLQRGGPLDPRRGEAQVGAFRWTSHPTVFAAPCEPSAFCVT
jgi:hypothetical protein